MTPHIRRQAVRSDPPADASSKHESRLPVPLNPRVCLLHPTRKLAAPHRWRLRSCLRSVPTSVDDRCCRRVSACGCARAEQRSHHPATREGASSKARPCRPPRPPWSTRPWPTSPDKRRTMIVPLGLFRLLPKGVFVTAKPSGPGVVGGHVRPGDRRCTQPVRTQGRAPDLRRRAHARRAHPRPLRF